MKRKELRKIVKSVLKTYKFDYLWGSKKKMIDVCVDYLVFHIDDSKVSKTQFVLATKNFFISVNNFHYQFSPH